MPRTYQDPVVTNRDPVHGDTETHPAYGQIRVGRRLGNTYLYGSDFLHQNTVVITINESDLHRSLNQDWAFARKQIVEVVMSEAQWATFVSSFNVGAGVQCTLAWREGTGSVPGLPAPNRAERFKVEANEKLASIAEELVALGNKVAENAAGLSKVKQADLLAHVEKALRTVNSSIPFVASQMGEHFEEVIEAAKSEVHGYIQNQINRAGLTALGATDVLMLEAPEGTE